MSNEKKIAVEFKKPWRGYNKGEIAGFDAETVEALAKAGVVEESEQTKGRRAAAAKKGDGEEKGSRQAKDDKTSASSDGDGKPPAGSSAGTDGVDDARP